MKSPFAFLLLIVLLGGCAMSDATQMREIDQPGYQIYSTTAANRIVTIRDKNDPRIFCTEPAPDVALDEDESFGFNLNLLTFGDSVDEGGSEGFAEAGLGGRSTNVLLTREIFYRTCEMMGNVALSDDAMVDLFGKSLDAIVEINKQNLGTGTQNTAGANFTMTSTGQAASKAATGSTSSASSGDQDGDSDDDSDDSDDDWSDDSDSDDDDWDD
mgnify:CR=1 FL=1